MSNTFTTMYSEKEIANHERPARNFQYIASIGTTATSVTVRNPCYVVNPTNTAGLVNIILAGETLGFKQYLAAGQAFKCEPKTVGGSDTTITDVLILGNN